MPLYTCHPVANGLRTDHPIPDLPFVDDQHIPVNDPAALENIGRNKGSNMWGREDKCGDGGWIAFTTDPSRRDLAWVVRWHPKHGRTVVVYQDDEASSMHHTLLHEEPNALLFRAGGYWWDGTTWYRPAQLWDAATEKFYRRPAPAAVTVTAASLIPAGNASQARLLNIADVQIKASPQGRWIDDLALWAAHQGDRDLSDAVVTLAAPELASDQLVGLAEIAKIAGVAASTLQDYRSSEEADIPPPQSTVHGRDAWARPVAEEWVEQRNRSDDGRIEAVLGNHEGKSLPIGTAEAWKRWSRTFFSVLWERPAWRKRWALQWRNQAAVEEAAKTLGWHVAASVTNIIPVHDLATTTTLALLRELEEGRRLHRTNHPHGEIEDWQSFGISAAVTKTLDWLVRHAPAVAGRAIERTIGQADRELGIPRRVTERSITVAMALDSTLSEETVRDFLGRVLSPDSNRSESG